MHIYTGEVKHFHVQGPKEDQGFWDPLEKNTGQQASTKKWLQGSIALPQGSKKRESTFFAFGPFGTPVKGRLVESFWCFIPGLSLRGFVGQLCWQVIVYVNEIRITVKLIILKKKNIPQTNQTIELNYSQTYCYLRLQLVLFPLQVPLAWHLLTTEP